MSKKNNYKSITITEKVDVDINLDDYKDEILDWVKENDLLEEDGMIDPDEYKEIRDLLHYGSISQEEFMAKVDELMGYKRNG